MISLLSLVLVSTFSLCSALLSSVTHILELRINNIIMARLFIYQKYFGGIDTSSRSLLLLINAGDIAEVHLSSNDPIYSDENYQTSLIGFLYEPVNSYIIAWYLTVPFNVYTYLYGPTNINFINILLDNGSNWNANLALLEISISVTYCLQLSGQPDPSYTYKFNVILLLNCQLLMNVMEKATVRTSENLRSRSLITNLQSGDQLMVTVPSGYGAFNYRND